MAKLTRMSTGVLAPEALAKPSQFTQERLARVAAALPSFHNTGSAADEVSLEFSAEAELPLAEKISAPNVALLSSGEFLTIPVELLHNSDANPRTTLDPQKITDLALSLVKEGQLQPLLVTRHPEIATAYMIIEGHTRRQAALRIGLAALSCIVLALPTRRARYVAGRTSNTMRNKLSDLDDGLAWAGLIAEGTFKSYGEINDALGLNYGPAHLSRFKAYADLSEECITAMREDAGKFTATVAGDLRRVFNNLGEQRTLNLIREINGGLSRAALANRVTRLLRAPSEDAPRRQIKEKWQVAGSRGLLALITRPSPASFSITLAPSIIPSPDFETKLATILQALLNPPSEAAAKSGVDPKPSKS